MHGHRFSDQQSAASAAPSAAFVAVAMPTEMGVPQAIHWLYQMAFEQAQREQREQRPQRSIPIWEPSVN